jgi:hypothetical protein
MPSNPANTDAYCLTVVLDNAPLWDAQHIKTNLLAIIRWYFMIKRTPV